ncbi:MAG: hypothetical protein WKF84_26870 [Pyrinomonadaceae bacterium]
MSVISSFRDRFVAFDFTTRIHDPGTYNLRLVATPRGGEQLIAVDDFTMPLDVGEKTQRVPLEIPDGRLWSPTEPNLYTLVAQLTGPTGSVSQIETHFGLRSIEGKGPQRLLKQRSSLPSMAFSINQVQRRLRKCEDIWRR